MGVCQKPKPLCHAAVSDEEQEPLVLSIRRSPSSGKLLRLLPSFASLLMPPFWWLACAPFLTRTPLPAIQDGRRVCNPTTVDNYYPLLHVRRHCTAYPTFARQFRTLCWCLLRIGTFRGLASSPCCTAFTMRFSIGKADCGRLHPIIIVVFAFRFRQSL